MINPSATHPTVCQAGQRGPGQCERAGTPSLPCSGEWQSPRYGLHCPVPIPAFSLLLSKLRKMAKTVQTRSFSVQACPVCGLQVPEEQLELLLPCLSRCQWLWSWLVPPHCPQCAAPHTRAVTRACCTRLFLVHVGVLLGKKPSSLSFRTRFSSAESQN